MIRQASKGGRPSSGILTLGIGVGLGDSEGEGEVETSVAEVQARPTTTTIRSSFPTAILLSLDTDSTLSGIEGSLSLSQDWVHHYPKRILRYELPGLLTPIRIVHRIP